MHTGRSQAFKVPCIVLLVIVILLLAVLLVFCLPGEKPVTGTFCSGDQVSGEDDYLALYADGRYSFYRQFGGQISGQYALEEYESFSLLTLTPEGGAPLMAVYDGKDHLLFQSEPGAPTLEPLARISDLPTIINVELEA